MIAFIKLRANITRSKESQRECKRCTKYSFLETQMKTLILVNKDIVPDDELLKTTLTDSYKLYTRLLDELRSSYPEIKPEWKYYGKKNGWLLKHLVKLVQKNQ